MSGKTNTLTFKIVKKVISFNCVWTEVLPFVRTTPPPSLPLLSRIPDLQNHFVYCWNYHCPPPSPFSQESQTYRIILYTAGTITAPLPPPSLKNLRLTESLCILLELSLPPPPPSLPLLSRIPDLQNRFVYSWNYHCPPPSPFSQESQTYRITLYTAGTITAPLPPPSLKNPRLTESFCILLELSLPPSLPLLSRIPDLQNHFVYCWNYHCPPPSPFSQESQTYRITLYTAGTITAPLPPPSLKNPRLTESFCILLELSLPPSLPLLSRISDLQNHFVYCWNYHCHLPPPSLPLLSRIPDLQSRFVYSWNYHCPPSLPLLSKISDLQNHFVYCWNYHCPPPPPSLKNPRLTESLCILLEILLPPLRPSPFSQKSKTYRTTLYTAGTITAPPPSLPLLPRIPDLQNHFVYCWNYYCPPPSPFSQESQTYRIILYTAGTITAPLPPPSLKNPRLTESFCILLELSLPPSLPLLSRIPDLQNHFVYCWNYHCPPPSPFSQESQTYRIILYTAGTITAPLPPPSLKNLRLTESLCILLELSLPPPPPPSPFSQESQTYRVALYTAGTITAPPPSPFSQKSQTYRTTLYTAGTITAPLLPLLSRIPNLQNHFVYCWKYYCPPSVPPPSLKNLRLTEPLCILLELLLPPLRPSPFSQESQTYRTTLYTAGTITAPPPPSLPLLPRIPDLQNHFVYCWNYHCPPPPPSLKNPRLTESLCILLEILLPPLRPSPFSQKSKTYRTTLYTAGTITAPPPSLPLLPRIPDLQNHFVYCWNYYCPPSVPPPSPKNTRLTESLCILLELSLP